MCGFQVGRQREGQMAVSEPNDDECLNIPLTFLAIRREIMPLLDMDSTLTPYDKYAHSGFWRLLTLRQNRLGEGSQFVPLSFHKGHLIQYPVAHSDDDIPSKSTRNERRNTHFTFTKIA